MNDAAYYAYPSVAPQEQGRWLGSCHYMIHEHSVCRMRRLWTVPGGDEARMRFVTDTVGVKLVTRQLPAESRALLRALLVARGRPLPAAWSSPPQTANGPASAAKHAGQRSSSPADGSDVPAGWSSAAVQPRAPLSDGLGSGKQGAAGAGTSSRDFSSQQPVWQCEVPGGPLYPPGQAATALQQQQHQQRALADTGIPKTHASADIQVQDNSRVGSGEQTSVGQEPRTSVAPAMTYEALQGLLQKVSSVLQGAAPDKGVAPLAEVIQEAGLPPGL